MPSVQYFTAVGLRPMRTHGVLPLASGVLAVSLALTACRAAPGDVRSSASGPTATVRTVVATPSPTAGFATAEELECDGDGAPAFGGAAADFGPPGGGSTPERALENFVESGLFYSVPWSGYERANESANAVMFVYRVDGRTKWRSSSRWVVTPGDVGGRALRACDLAEMGPDADFDRCGRLDA